MSGTEIAPDGQVVTTYECAECLDTAYMVVEDAFRRFGRSYSVARFCTCQRGLAALVGWWWPRFKRARAEDPSLELDEWVPLDRYCQRHRERAAELMARLEHRAEQDESERRAGHRRRPFIREADDDAPF